MAVRADWGLDCVEAPDDGDPFSKASVPTPVVPVAPDVERDGKRVQLGDHPLDLQLVELVNEEGRLWGEGVRCTLKELPEMTCQACPINRGGSPFPLSQLCKVGVAQERAQAELIVMRRGS